MVWFSYVRETCFFITDCTYDKVKSFLYIFTWLLDVIKILLQAVIRLNWHCPAQLRECIANSTTQSVLILIFIIHFKIILVIIRSSWLMCDVILGLNHIHLVFCWKSAAFYEVLENLLWKLLHYSDLFLTQKFCLKYIFYESSH